jgi:hypothetical protein
MLDPWRPLRAVRFLASVGFLAVPRRAPSWVPQPASWLFWRPTVILQRPDQYGSWTSFPDEAWFFINGVATTDEVAQLNAAFISDLFHRPVTIIQNSTCGLVPDLVECALSKQSPRTTEAARKAFPAIHAALKSGKHRVVIIAHSQGTIITSVVLHLLEAMTSPASSQRLPKGGGFAGPVFVLPEDYDIDPSHFPPLTEAELARLEVYCFANCASRMKHCRAPVDGGPPIPWIESFGNEHDIVARLGMLAPRAAKWGIEIDGPRYVADGACGHLLNEHYLAAIEPAQKVGHKPGGRGGTAPYRLLNGDDYPGATTPRLFRYINGGTGD